MVSRRVLKILDKRKQVNLQWLQKLSQANGDNLNSVRHETNRTFRHKEREYLKEKASLKQTVTKKNIRNLYGGINECKKGYQPRTQEKMRMVMYLQIPAIF
jgi:hypothetical protein